MLRNALRKDLLLNARHLWGILPWFVWVAYAMSEPDAGRMMAVGAGFIGSLMATTIAAREDKLRTSATLASLPVSRRILVQARYVVAYVVGTATYLVVAAMAAVLPWSVQDSAELFEVKTVLLTVTLASMAIALLMPVVLRDAAQFEDRIHAPSYRSRRSARITDSRNDSQTLMPTITAVSTMGPAWPSPE